MSRYSYKASKLNFSFIAVLSGVLRLTNSTLAMLYMMFKLGQYCGRYIECKFGYRI